MRTVEEISQEIKQAFVANPVLQEAYSLIPGQTFDDQFPASSVEANLIAVISINIAANESLWDSYKQEVDQIILSSYPGTVAWYHQLILNFVYSGEKIVKYCAVVEEYPNLLIKVNGVDFEKFAVESDQLIALRAFVAQNKFAGTQVVIVSREPDDVIPGFNYVKLDAQVFNSSGENLETGIKDVEIAIDEYLSSVKYNGSLNLMKLIDAVQAVHGVLDLSLEWCVIKKEGGEVSSVTSGDFQSYGGAFVSTEKYMNYVLA